jgi:hypothetical protein
MQVRIVQLAHRSVMGTETRIQPMGADYGTHWPLGFDPHLNEIQPLATEKGFYGIDFVAGMMVPEGALPPAGCVMRPVPGGTYARFDCTMAAIGST